MFQPIVRTAEAPFEPAPPPSREEMSRAQAHAEIVSVPVLGADEPGLPDGAVQLTYLDASQIERQIEVVAWRRLDIGDFAVGTEFRVDVQARRIRDLRLPVHHVSARLRLTHAPADRANVLVGDPRRVGSWAFGVLFSGVVLVDATLVLDGQA